MQILKVSSYILYLMNVVLLGVPVFITSKHQISHLQGGNHPGLLLDLRIWGEAHQGQDGVVGNRSISVRVELAEAKAHSVVKPLIDPGLANISHLSSSHAGGNKDQVVQLRPPVKNVAYKSQCYK